jgi:hypothetical protein
MELEVDVRDHRGLRLMIGVGSPLARGGDKDEKFSFPILWNGTGEGNYPHNTGRNRSFHLLSVIL